MKDEIDLEEVMREIRRRAEVRREEEPDIEREIELQKQFFPPLPAAPDDRFRALEMNLRQANLHYAGGFTPDKTRFAFLKRFILRLIRPYTDPTREFHGYLVRVLNQMAEIHRDQREILDRQMNLRERAAPTAQQAELVEMVQTFNEFFQEDWRDRFRERMARLYEEAHNAEVRAIADENRRFAAAEPPPLGMDTLAFQDRFRGEESEIRRRLKKYAVYFEHRAPVLDIGCGRGEFLEILREHQIEASGVDLDAAMVRRCQSKGLAAVEGDMFEHLGMQPKDSLGGIFAAQLVEHLHYSSLLHFIALAGARLKPGGVFVMETVNPASLFVFAHSLYLDPTHIRPYHPLGLEFLCRHLGFSRTEILYGSPVEPEFKLPFLTGSDTDRTNQAIERLNNLLYGPQDFAIVAYR